MRRSLGLTFPEGVAERKGFEPPVPCGTAVFKTAAFDHSATSPAGKNTDASAFGQKMFATADGIPQLPLRLEWGNDEGADLPSTRT